MISSQRLLDRGGVLLDEDELRAHRERLAQPHPRLHSRGSAAAVTGPTSGSVPGAGASAAGASASLGLSRSAALQLETGNERGRRSWERMFYTRTGVPVKRFSNFAPGMPIADRMLSP